MNVALLYGPPWDGAAQFSKHHLARYLARRGHRVLYVEAPLSPLALARGNRIAALRSTLRHPRQVAPGLWVRRYFNPIPYHGVTRITSLRQANLLGQRLLAGPLRRDLARLRMWDPVLLAGLPHAADLAPLVPHALLAYHCADDYTHVRGFPTSLGSTEADLCRQSRLVITTAESLRAARASFNPRTYWVPNGVDYDRFAADARPAGDMPRDGHAVVGFVGSISQWVDLDLVREIAGAHPEWHVVLIGPSAGSMPQLQGLPNVRLLGPRPYDAIPQYLAGMNVALIPFQRDEVSRMADPIKAYEYLAAGVPVVATRIPALERLSHVVALADSTPGFIRLVEEAVAAGRDEGRQARQAEARRHSWESRFEQIEGYIREALCGF